MNEHEWNGCYPFAILIFGRDVQLYTCNYLYVNSIHPSANDQSDFSTSRNLQKLIDQALLQFCIEKSFSKATVEWRIWGCSWSYWMSYRKSGMFQRCSIVSNSQIQEGKQKLHSRDSIFGCGFHVTCRSIIGSVQQQHQCGISLGRPRIQKQPATVPTYQDEP